MICVLAIWLTCSRAEYVTLTISIDKLHAMANGLWIHVSVNAGKYHTQYQIRPSYRTTPHIMSVSCDANISVMSTIVVLDRPTMYYDYHMQSNRKCLE